MSSSNVQDKVNLTVETFEKKPISKTIKYFYGVGDLGFAFMTNMSSYLFMFFLTNVAGFSLATVAIMTSSIAIIGAITSPLNGAIISSTKPMRWGRYRSWLIVPIPLVLIFIPLMWSTYGGEITSAILIVVFQVIGSQAFNFMYVSNASLIAVVASTPAERAQMSATRGMYNNLSKVLWAYVGSPMVAVMGVWLGREMLGYTAMQLIFCLACAIGYIAHFKMTKGYEETGAQELAKPKDKQSKTSPKQLWDSLVKNPHLFTMLIMDLGRWLVQFTMLAATIYFFKYVAQDMSLQVTYLFVANLCAIIGSYMMRFIVQKVGVRNTGLIAFFGLGIFLAIARVFYLNNSVVMVFLVLAQLFLGISYTIIPVLYADSVVYSEWKMGKDASGWIMGLMQVPLKSSGFIKNLIITGLLAVGGYSATADPASSSPALKVAIGNMFIGVPALIMLLSACIFLLGYRLTAAKIEQYRKEINERKAAI